MNPFEELFRIAKILLSEEDDEQTAKVLLERVVGFTGAERAFIVVRGADGNFEQKFAVRFDRDTLSKDERRFSVTLVRTAQERGETIYMPSVIEDSSLKLPESTRMAIGQSSVLVAPLLAADEVYGVIYLQKPQRAAFSDADRAFLQDFAEVAGLMIRRALEHQALRERTRSLEQDLFARHDFRGIVARDPRMTAVLSFVAQVADTDAPVLIQGETGTGKELIARALHVNGGRREMPLVTVHCSALPKELLESELFGHLAGAYTDAKRDRTGRIASAEGGTLFLDEIGEIPLEAQAKLLRFLQFGEIQRVGSDRVLKVDCRVVAATHRDLRAMCQEGTFREDLYFRLKVLDVRLPPLRERPSDIPLLMDHFLERHWRLEGTPRWSPEAARALESYTYPGNVRELAHVVERAAILARGPTIDLDLLPPEVSGVEPRQGTSGPPRFRELTNDELKTIKEERANEVEREFLKALMAQAEGNVSRAARESGIHRSFLQKLLARHRAELGDLAIGA